MIPKPLPKEVLVAEDVAWQLGGSNADEWQYYWIFDPHQVLLEFRNIRYGWRRGKDDELFNGLCETFWLEDSSEVQPGENVFFFRTEADARTFQRNWYETH